MEHSYNFSCDNQITQKLIRNLRERSSFIEEHCANYIRAYWSCFAFNFVPQVRIFHENAINWFLATHSHPLDTDSPKNFCIYSKSVIKIHKCFHLKAENQFLLRLHKSSCWWHRESFLVVAADKNKKLLLRSSMLSWFYYSRINLAKDVKLR